MLYLLYNEVYLPVHYLFSIFAWNSLDYIDEL